MREQIGDKEFLILGAAGLLGSNLVKAALEQGAKVIAADLDVGILTQRLAQIEVSTSSKKLFTESVDVLDELSVREVLEKYPNLDGAVNLTYPRNREYGKHFFDVSMESFNDNLSLHLGSAFLFTQQCAKYFNTHGRHFSLVNFSSIYGVVAPKFDIYKGTSMTTPVEYSAIKAAIQHLSKYTAAYVGNSKFRVNCVSPGGIFDSQPESFLQAYKQNTNGKGMLDVKDLMGTVLYLLSGYSQFVTGQNIVVDDGFTL